MTDLLSPEDTGEIVDLTDTVRFDVDATQAIQPYDPYAPTHVLRLLVTEERPAPFVAETFAFIPEVVDLDSPPPPPPLPPMPPGPIIPGRHALNERYGEYPIVRPHMTPGRKRGRRSRGRWVVYGVLTGVGGLLLVEAAVALGAWLVLR